MSAPVITTQPSSGSFGVGSRLTLYCLAEGFPSPIYSWFLDGVNLMVAFTPLTFDITPGNRGEYSCNASNSQGQASSNQAFITLNGRGKWSWVMYEISDQLTDKQCAELCTYNFAVSDVRQYLVSLSLPGSGGNQVRRRRQVQVNQTAIAQVI